nr:11303_t:CDS:2 [Entrophospora candida]
MRYSLFGSGLMLSDKKLEERYSEIKNSPNFYQEAPFLTIAEDLLKLIKEDRVEQLIFLSAYDKRKFPKGDDRKYEIFRETFAKLAKNWRDILRSLGGVGIPFSEIKVIAPYYPAVENQHDKNVLLVKNEYMTEKKDQEVSNSNNEVDSEKVKRFKDVKESDD